MKQGIKKFWIEFPVDRLRKLDLIAKRMGRSRQKQAALFLNDAIDASYLATERKPK